MARVAEQVAEPKAPYTVSLAHFMEGAQELNYPIEMYKDGYFRVIGAHREHWQGLRDGWSEEREPGATYKPMSAHPDNVAKAAKQQAKLAADQEAERAAASGGDMVSMDKVKQMIADALNSRPAAFSVPIPEDED